MRRAVRLRCCWRKLDFGRSVVKSDREALNYTVHTLAVRIGRVTCSRGCECIHTRELRFAIRISAEPWQWRWEGTAVAKARLPRGALRLGAMAPPIVTLLGVYTCFYDELSCPSWIRRYIPLLPVS